MHVPTGYQIARSWLARKSPASGGGAFACSLGLGCYGGGKSRCPATAILVGRRSRQRPGNYAPRRHHGRPIAARPLARCGNTSWTAQGVGSFRRVFSWPSGATLRPPIASGVLVTCDDPFVVSMNIIRLQTLLNAEIDDAARRTVCQLLNEFEEAAALASPRIPHLSPS